MLFTSSNEVSILVDHLLGAFTDQEAMHILQVEEQRHLNYKRNKFQQKMPRQLISSGYLSEHENNIKNKANKEDFPTMFDSIDKKIYQYIDENIQTMKIISENKKIKDAEDSHMLFQYSNLESKVVNQPKEKNISKDQRSLELQQQEHSEGNQHKNPSNLQNDNFDSTLLKRDHKRMSPFIPNTRNYNDIHANSKSFQNKYPYLHISEHSRNITSMAQSSKFNAFSGSLAFPSSVMQGNISKPNQQIFSTSGQLDIKDVMRYTLGVDRTHQEDQKKIENPFVRIPKKKQ